MAVISEGCGCREVVRKSSPHTTHNIFILRTSENLFHLKTCFISNGKRNIHYEKALRYGVMIDFAQVRGMYGFLYGFFVMLWIALPLLKLGEKSFENSRA